MTSSSGVCKFFINLSDNSYKPLACKPLTVTSEDDIGESGINNAYKAFFLMKRSTSRESATIDMLYPTPNFVRFARQRGN